MYRMANPIMFTVSKFWSQKLEIDIASREDTVNLVPYIVRYITEVLIINN